MNSLDRGPRPARLRGLYTMPKKRLSVAKSVAERLFAAETALDHACASAGELHALLPMARLDAKLAASVGQDAFQQSAAAIMLMAQAREQIVAMHASLKEAGDSIGLGEIGYGDLIKPKSTPSKGAVANGLRAVG